MVRAAMLRRHLTEDQRAYLAEVWREHLTENRKSQRATKAAAAKAGSLSSETDDKQVVGPRPDSRKEAAMEFKIPENKLKSLAQIRRYEKDEKVPTEKSLLRDIRDGHKTLTSAVSQIRRDDEKKKQTKRLEAARKLPDLKDLLQGDITAVLRRLKDADKPPGFRAVILDPDDPGEIEAVLKATKPLLLPDSAVLTFSTYENEKATLALLKDAGFPANGRFIWSFRDGAVGHRHMSVFWSLLGTFSFHDIDSDILLTVRARASEDIPDRPVELISKLVEISTIEREVLLAPWGSRVARTLSRTGPSASARIDRYSLSSRFSPCSSIPSKSNVLCAWSMRITEQPSAVAVRQMLSAKRRLKRGTPRERAATIGKIASSNSQPS
jgi:hypothetical protein